MSAGTRYRGKYYSSAKLRKIQNDNLEPPTQYYQSNKERKIPYYKMNQNQALTCSYSRTPLAHENNKFKLGSTSFSSARHSGDPKKRELAEDGFSEEMRLIENFWKDLGVRNDYKLLFKSMVNEYERSVRKELLNIEIESLNKFKDAMTEIYNRENTISVIHQLDEDIEVNIKEGYLDLNEDLYKEIIKTFQALRIHSVNVINSMNKFRENSFFYNVHGKYNLDRAASYYDYDKNYLIKMKRDLNFLYDSNLSYYFCFTRESDPFLLSITVAGEIMRTDNIDYNKYIVPVSKDLMASIVQAEFILMQDNLFSELKANKETIPNAERMPTDYSETLGSTFKVSNRRKFDFGQSQNISKSNMSKMIHNLKSEPDYNYLFCTRNGVAKKETTESYRPKQRHNRIKIDREEIRAMSRNELLRKFGEYDKLLLDYENERELNIAMKNRQEKQEIKNKGKEEENEADITEQEDESELYNYVAEINKPLIR